VIYRTDHWRGWRRELHTDLPIPIRGSAASPVVTNTELALVDEIRTGLGLNQAPMFLEFSRRDVVFADPERLEAIQAELYSVMGERPPVS
jgi:hypothetical protein